MTLAGLYDIAASDDIEIASINCPESGSISIMTNDLHCYVGIDSRIQDESEILVCTAHEIGHCETGAFYNRYSRFNVISKLERKANVWAIKTVLPREEFAEAYKKGCSETWQLAEYFDLPQYFIELAVDYYKGCY